MENNRASFILRHTLFLTIISVVEGLAVNTILPSDLLWWIYLLFIVIIAIITMTIYTILVINPELKKLRG